MTPVPAAALALVGWYLKSGRSGRYCPVGDRPAPDGKVPERLCGDNPRQNRHSYSCALKSNLKLGHSDFQTRPLDPKLGQYPLGIVNAHRKCRQ